VSTLGQHAQALQALMTSDINEQVFDEKELYTNDVIDEDGDVDCVIPYCALDNRGVTSPDPPGGGVGGGAPSVRGSRGGRSSGGGGTVASELPLDRKEATYSKLSGAGRERRRRRVSNRATLIVYWLETKYDLITEVTASLENWKAAQTALSDFDLMWCDQAVSADRFMKLKPYQKMNHFVGMSCITRKNNLGRNLLRMRKQFPKEYKFFPDTWILPTDLNDFKLQFTSAKNKTFIMKPDNGCQGKGIFLIREVDKVPVDFSTTYVAQRYLHKPFLLDGHKFDLRLYVLVIGCDPLRIFLHSRGLVRLASEHYMEPTVKNLGQSTVHLTNYALNKLNPNFEENTDPDDAQDGHKRSWEAVYEYLKDQDYDVEAMMKDIEDLIIKTLIAVQPSLSHFYHSCQPDDAENALCFDILGFDVILDQNLQPWLSEVNHAPFFATESVLDRVVKHEVLIDTFSLLNLSPENRRRHKREAREKMEQRAMGIMKKQSLEERMAEEHAVALERTAWEEAHVNGYKRLYPSEEKEREYMQIHDAAINIWEMLMGGNSRRSVRLTQQVPEVEDQEKPRKSQVDDGAPRKGSGENAAEQQGRERRSPDEMREVVERLTAGCSARPRESCKTRRHGNKQDSKLECGGVAGWTSSTADSAIAAVQTSDDEVPGAVGGGEHHSVEEEFSPKPSVQPSTAARSEIKVGDVIKVQTNLGWESVIVKAKRTNGKMDILFRDGEYMRSVLPRVLREPSVQLQQHQQPLHKLQHQQQQQQQQQLSLAQQLQQQRQQREQQQPQQQQAAQQHQEQSLQQQQAPAVAEGGSASFCRHGGASASSSSASTSPSPKSGLPTHWRYKADRGGGGSASTASAGTPGGFGAAVTGSAGGASAAWGSGAGGRAPPLLPPSSCSSPPTDCAAAAAAALLAPASSCASPSSGWGPTASLAEHGSQRSRASNSALGPGVGLTGRTGSALFQPAPIR